jgi:formiminotetrahydrofolate cyclodeaminase
LNVEINVGSLTDAEYTSSVTAEINRLGAEAARSADEADALL